MIQQKNRQEEGRKKEGRQESNEGDVGREGLLIHTSAMDWQVTQAVPA